MFVVQPYQRSSRGSGYLEAILVRASQSLPPTSCIFYTFEVLFAAVEYFSGNLIAIQASSLATLAHFCTSSVFLFQ